MNHFETLPRASAWKIKIVKIECVECGENGTYFVKRIKNENNMTKDAYCRDCVLALDVEF